MRIIQLTDLHLMTDPASEIRGVRTRDTFERVLQDVEAGYADADRMIITGDLTHDEKRSTYEWLRARLKDWIDRLRVIPGNHDDRAIMRDVFEDRLTKTRLADRNVFVEELGDWRLIGLDSHVPGELRGELGAEQRAWLKEELRSTSNRPTCLFLHHPPVEVQSAWLDRIGLTDAGAFRETIEEFPQACTLFCGHIHQERTIRFGPSIVLSSPSTGVQFRPETEALVVDSIAPGFRMIDLGENGKFHTRVERVMRG
jgi:Icc protein